MLLGGLAVLIGLGAWLIAARDTEPAPDDSLPDTSLPDADIAVPIDLAGPLDGLESLELPIAVTPDDGLVDQQTIEVSGAGFTPGATIAMVQCWLGETGSRDDCDLGNIGVAHADVQGAFTRTMLVHRFIDTGNGIHDCVSGDATEGCRIGVGNTLDLDESGGAAIFFAAVDAVEPPTIDATPTTGLRDGDLISLGGRGFESDSQVVVTQCPVGGLDDASSGCTSRNPGETIDIGADGGFAITVTASRHRVSEDGPHDCALEVYGCMLVVRALGPVVDTAALDGCGENGPVVPSEVPTTSTGDPTAASTSTTTVAAPVDVDECARLFLPDRSPNPIPLDFDPGVAPVLPPEYTVTPSQGLENGSIVRLDVFDMPVDGSFGVRQCADGGPRGLFCDPRGVIDVVDGDGGVDIIVVATLTLADDSIDCTEPARRCYLALDGALAEEVRGPLRFEP